MGIFHFTWAPDGPLGRLTWKAAVPQGCYEIDNRTLAARFVRSKPDHAVDAIAHPHTNLEEAQRFCEQHWRILVREASDSSSRRSAVGNRKRR
jgi:hypothetical protein